LKEAIAVNKELGRQLSLETMQQLYAERALLQRERELLRNTEDGGPVADIELMVEMRQNLEDMMRQKRQVKQVLGKYIDKYGSIDDGHGNQTPLPTTTSP
jgi:hypothetical protein